MITFNADKVDLCKESIKRVSNVKDAITRLTNQPIPGENLIYVNLEDYGYKKGTEGYNTALKRREDNRIRVERLRAERNIPESVSTPEAKIIESDSHALVGAMDAAYANHYPLVLSPDMIWVTIAQGLAAHINKNAKKLRKQFVDFDGKKYIEIERDTFVKGSNNNWEGCFPEFSDKLSEFIGKKRDLIVSSFSTTTPADKAISEIVLMDAMQSYFDYGCRTLCGIPSITLEGTTDDWKNIKQRVQVMSEFDLGFWTKHLEPVIDEFITASKGNPNKEFWQNIYKVSGGSGGPYISGAIVNFFPYIKTYKEDKVINAYLGKAARMMSGMTSDMFPNALSKVPFKWIYYSQEFKMEFIGGLVGYEQRDDLSLRPKMGWAVREVKESNAKDNSR